MTIFDLLRHSRARKRELIRTVKEIESQEQEEQAERSSAIPVMHSAVRTVFRIPEPIDGSGYVKSDGALPRIKEITRLHPDAAPPRTRTQEAARLIGSGEMSVWIPYRYEQRAEKYYELISGIDLIRHFEAHEMEGSLNCSPVVLISYYNRKLHNINTFGSARLGYAGGVQTSMPQFAAVIHDGHDKVLDPSSPRYSGILTGTNYLYPIKEPIRLVLLGELDEKANTMAVRRIIVDGVQRALTMENVGLALSYAERLVGQIFGGKEYTPGANLPSEGRAAPQRHDAPLLRRDRAKTHDRGIK